MTEVWKCDSRMGYAHLCVTFLKSHVLYSPTRRCRYRESARGISHTRLSTISRANNRLSTGPKLKWPEAVLHVLSPFRTQIRTCSQLWAYQRPRVCTRLLSRSLTCNYNPSSSLLILVSFSVRRKNGISTQTPLALISCLAVCLHWRIVLALGANPIKYRDFYKHRH